MNIGFYFTLREKACLPFLNVIPPFGEIVVNYPFNIGKTLNSIDLVNLMSSISVRFNSFSFFIRFSMNIKFLGSLRVVGLDGLEPSTSRLSGVRSNHLSYKPFFSLIWYWFAPSSSSTFRLTGGDDGVRTHDPLLAGQVLSQLSYTPVSGLLYPISKIRY